LTIGFRIKEYKLNRNDWKKLYEKLDDSQKNKVKKEEIHNISKGSEKNNLKLKIEKFGLNLDISNNNRIRQKSEKLNDRIWGKFYGVIYKITDTESGKVYIGQTVQSLKKRLNNHLNNPPNKYLQAAIDHYGKVKWTIKKIDKENYRTKGGEFVIKVVKYCNTIKELNESEVRQIKQHKSCIIDYYYIYKGQKISLYGYNVHRGGGRRFYVFGPLHHMYIPLNKKDLENLIKRGYFAHEIAKELDTSISTIKNRIQDLWGYKNISKAREKLGGMPSYNSRLHYIINRTIIDRPKYVKDIDIELLTKYVRDGLFIREITKKMGVSDDTLYKRIKWIGYFGFNEFRKDVGGWEIFLERQSKVRKKKYEVDEDLLKKLLKKDLSKKEIADRIGVSPRKLYDIIKELWNLNFQEAKKIFTFYPKIDSKLLNELFIEQISVEEIDEEFLKALINRGNEPKDLIKLYGLKSRQSLDYKLKVTLGTFFTEAKNTYYTKPRIIDQIRHGLIAKKMRVEGLTEAQIYYAIKRIWKKEYYYYTKRGRSFRAFFNYLIRIYKIYPDLEDEKYQEVIEEMLFDGSNPDEIDSEILKILIGNGYEIKDLEKKYDRKYDSLKSWIRQILGFNYTQAKNEYFWKPKIIKGIKTFAFPFLEKIAGSLGISERNLKEIIKRIWKKELVEKGGMGELFKYLKDI